MSGGITAIAAPQVCGEADVALAHEQMRIHRGCRVDRCVWKAAAFHTLVKAGRMVPQALSPRIRAAMRGIAFPALDHEPPPIGGPSSGTLRAILDKLDELATPVPGLHHSGRRYTPHRPG